MMRKFIITGMIMTILTLPLMGQDDNGNRLRPVWYSSLDEFTKGNIINAGMDTDNDGWGEFFLWDVQTQTYLLYEAFGDDQYHIVYQDSGLMNFYDLDLDGQLELVKIHEDKVTLEQWITIHEWNNINLDSNLSGGFTEPTKTTNRFSRAIWNNIAEGHGFDRGLLDFVKLDGDDDWDIFAVDAKLTFWGGKLVRWNEGTIINVLEMTDFNTATPQVTLRYTSGPLKNGMLFFGIWNNYIDIDKDGLMDILLVSDHTKSLMGIRTAGNDSYDPIVLSVLPDIGFYHIPTFPVVANFDNDEEQEIYFGDLDGQLWFMHTTTDFESTLGHYNIFYLSRIVKKQNSPGATNMLMGGHVGDLDGDGKPNIYYCSKDISSLIDVEYQSGYAGDSLSFSYTYTPLVSSNGQPMTATMWNMSTGTRYRFAPMDLDHDNKREIIIGGPDTDHMIFDRISTVYIYESEHEVFSSVTEKILNLPEKITLLQNYPNPFNPGTTICYQITETGKVVLRIFNVLGEEVRYFEASHDAPGIYSIYWNGTDNTGMAVQTGLYLFHIFQGNFAQQKKMMLLK